MRGFTLLELLISVVIAMFMLITLYTVFWSLLNFQSRWIDIRQGYDTNNFLLNLQEQMLFCRNFRWVKDGDSIILEYNTTAGYTSPFVRVRVIINPDKIIYAEIKPPEEEVVYKKILIARVEKLSVEKEYIELLVNGRKVIILIKEASKPPTVF